ncbi:MAG: BamA/OMP85 family outer membrane protein [Fusobacteriaceae bacterium]
MRRYLVILLGILTAFVTYAETTKDNYVVNSVEIYNNREIPEELILSQMDLKKGDRFSTENLIKDYNKLKKLDYINELSIFPKSYDGGIKLVIEVREKSDAKILLEKKGIIPNSERNRVDTTLVVTDLKIQGLRHLDEYALEKKLDIETGGYFSEKKIMDGQKLLVETGNFSSVEYEIIKSTNGVEIIYTVVENPILNGINIIGNTIFTTEDILKTMKTKPGEVFSVKTIREDRERILNKYYDAGYILAEIIDIDINNNLELEFVLSEGTIRNVEYKKMITKQKGARRKPTDDILKTKDFVIKREVEIFPDTVFNIKSYDETSKNLMRTGHFKNIKYNANTIPGDPDGRSLVLLMDEERTAVLQGAVSYGSEIGLLGMLSVRDTNWSGRGQNLGVTFEKSNESYSSFSLDFYDPWIEGTDRLSWGWSLYKTSSEVDDSNMFNEIDSYGGKINIGKGLSKDVRISLGGKLEEVKETPKSGALDKKGVLYQDDKYMLWSLFPSITYDTRNNPLNATSGEYAKFQLEGGYASGNNADYFGNITLELRKYHRGFFKKNTIAYRAVAGLMTTSTKESQRFWVGGNSLRGYDGGFFQGTQKLVLTVENRTQINDVLGFVVFADAGRAWDQRPEDTGYSNLDRDRKFPDEIATSAGVGLRINTPMGPLRFDFGWPVGRKVKGTDGMQFYFNMGQSF